MGGYVFLEYMSFSLTCNTGTFACFVGGHVLWEDMSCRGACLHDGLSFRMMCHTGMHVYRRTDLT